MASAAAVQIDAAAIPEIVGTPAGEDTSSLPLLTARRSERD